MKISATQLRNNIYKILDKALETGFPVEIERKGKKLKIVPEKKGKKLSKLKAHKCMAGDPDIYVSVDWSNEWSEKL